MEYSILQRVDQHSATGLAISIRIGTMYADAAVVETSVAGGTLASVAQGLRHLNPASRSTGNSGARIFARLAEGDGRFQPHPFFAMKGDAVRLRCAHSRGLCDALARDIGPIHRGAGASRV